jgi:hypothetical protein
MDIVLNSTAPPLQSLTIIKLTTALIYYYVTNLLTVLNCNMFQPLQGHLQGVYLIHSGSVGQQNEAPDVKFNCTVTPNTLS